jgi:hypothetical protein
MKKIFILLSLASIILVFTTCKKDEEVVKFISPNKLSVEINGKVENDFSLYGLRSKYTPRLYDTIPFPRYYYCKNEKELFDISILRKLNLELEEGLSFRNFFPFINVKQRYKDGLILLPQITPKNICDYDTTFSTNYIVDLGMIDYVEVNYKVDEKGVNDLTITSYDALSGKMTGEFNLTFDKIYRNIREKYYESLPQKLEYRNGKFTVFFKPIK